MPFAWLLLIQYISLPVQLARLLLRLRRPDHYRCPRLDLSQYLNHCLNHYLVPVLYIQIIISFNFLFE